MRNLLRPLAGWWGHALGAAGVVEDALATVRDRRLTRAADEQLTTSARAAALAQARQGCTHNPPCPPASAPNRTAAAEAFSDAACIYLCNGLILATRQLQAPDAPSGLYTPMPETERTP
ncbi:hypothetical protein [Streptomyces sp. NPDC001389]|uniref:hypothetical protein n=1 Tax=Streptomyces sp. NPDC001389 TaxID=3364569 RepID=UPI0036CA1838